MIKDIKISDVPNSAGEKAIQVTIITENGNYNASVPSGTSRGAHEAACLPYEKVLKIFPLIKSKIIGMEYNQVAIDARLQEIDGTENFRKIGSNLALGISLAAARAFSENKFWIKPEKNYSFPVPVGNVIGGGMHGGGADWQEFLIIPHKARNPAEALKTMTDIWNSVGKELKKKRLVHGYNLESAWKAEIDDIKTLDFLCKITEDYDVRLGIDFAATELWNGRTYKYRHMKKEMNTDKQIDLLIETTKQYKLFYLEDPFREDDFESFSFLTKKLGSCLIVGDDLYCTNINRLKKGVKKRSSNAAIIKPNQVGTFSLASAAVKFAAGNKIKPVISHRSKETMDNWISDLALLWSIPMIKTGIHGPERISKHKRLDELWKKTSKPRMASL